MNRFSYRMEKAAEHEQAVLEELRRRGWRAEPFGQAQLSPVMRAHLRQVETPVRWMADIIAGKRFAARTVIVYVDAKTSIDDRWRTTGNHSIEIDAVTSAEKWIELSGQACPYFFVFGDMRIMTPADIRTAGRPGHLRRNTNGSGTPFLLVSANAARPFDSAFGVASSEAM